VEDVYVEGRDGGGSFFFFCWLPVRQTKSNARRNRTKNAKAAAEAEAQIGQQDHARCLSYGKPGSAAYIDCRSSFKK